MRKVTKEAIESFIKDQPYKKSNTQVYPGAFRTYLSLHNNEIAYKEDGRLFISNAGWFSNTTKERLNGLPGVSISQKAGVWYLNGYE